MRQPFYRDKKSGRTAVDVSDGICPSLAGIWRTAAEVLDRDFFLRYDAAGKEYRGQNESDQN